MKLSYSEKLPQTLQLAWFHTSVESKYRKTLNEEDQRVFLVFTSLFRADGLHVGEIG